MPAPPPVQFSQLQFAKPTTSPYGAQGMQDLGKNLAKAKATLMPSGPTPGPGAVDATVGTPGSAYAGPVAPGATPPVGLTPQQSAAIPPAPPAPPPPVMPQQPAVQPQAQPTGIADYLRNLSPLQNIDILRRMTQTGQPVIPPGMPGSAALGGAGMLPTMNNPSQFGG